VPENRVFERFKSQNGDESGALKRKIWQNRDKSRFYLESGLRIGKWGVQSVGRIFLRTDEIFACIYLFMRYKHFCSAWRSRYYLGL